MGEWRPHTPELLDGSRPTLQPRPGSRLRRLRGKPVGKPKPGEIKIIFFDIDDTVVDKKTRTCPQSAIDALQELRESGIKIVVATWRNLTIPADYTVLDGLGPFDAYITNQGSLTYLRDEDGNRTILDDQPLDPDDVASIINSGSPTMHHHKGEITLKGDADELWKTVNGENPEYCDMRPRQSDAVDHIYQVTCLATEPAHEMKRTTPWAWGPHLRTMLPSYTSKDTGVRVVLKHFGLSHKQAAAFGDSSTDMTLLRAVRWGVAMGNGTSAALKEQAWYVARPLLEDGLRDGLIRLRAIKGSEGD